MGFLDKVKEKAQAGLEKGQEVAKEQQSKHELKKLESDLDEAYAAFGRAAFALREAGTLSASELEPEAQAVRDALSARDAKQAELAGEADGDGSGPASTE
jgi:hypothetical protein